LQAAHEWLELVIEDDGSGLRAAPHDDGHFGILGMTERVRALGGALSVESRDERGTQVVARIPLGHRQGRMSSLRYRALLITFAVRTNHDLHAFWFATARTEEF
jgi:signal transduction histidine kinase